MITMRRTRVKICGFTQPSDALVASELGVDAIGLVFYPPSPRNVGIEQAVAISQSLPAFVTLVALFVDPDRAFVEEVIKQVGIDLIQFHGNEPAKFCGSFSAPYIKAVRMHGEVDLTEIEKEYGGAKGILLDAWHPTEKGGTGEQFDWKRIPADFKLPIILAGGLTPENIGLAIETARPFAVDLSSGVEQSKGIKDHAKMARLLTEVNRFECKNEL
jgi:phosphoribosylanthranilate isomerase